MKTKATKEKVTVKEIVNEKVLDQLKNGEIPWHKNWVGTSNVPISRDSGKPYSLCNQLTLGAPGEYVTPHKCSIEGGRIKKGEKASIVTFWKPLDRGNKEENADQESDDKRPYFVLVYYKVFHISQCEGLAPKYEHNPPPPFDPDTVARNLVGKYTSITGCFVRDQLGETPKYMPSSDRIIMPTLEQFHSHDAYWDTHFKLMVHSTGIPSRLNRVTPTDIIDMESFTKERLISEIVSSCLLNALGLAQGGAIMDREAYIQGWISALEADKNMLVSATSRAEKALRYILNPAPVIMEDAGAADDEAVNGMAKVIAYPGAGSNTPKDADGGVEENAKHPAIPKPKPTDVKTKQMHGAALRFANKCVKENGTKRPNIAGAFMLGDRQCIMDGHVGVAYKKPFSDLPFIRDGVEPVPFDKYLEDARKGILVALPTLSDLKTQYKIAKAGKRKYVQATKLGIAYVNTGLLITAMELAGVMDGTIRVTNAASALHLEGVDCEAMVCPMLVTNPVGLDVYDPQAAA